MKTFTIQQAYHQFKSDKEFIIKHLSPQANAALSKTFASQKEALRAMRASGLGASGGWCVSEASTPYVTS